MDIVITYVNGQDPEWQASYADAIGGKPAEKRFRDWGTLKYLFRGIQKNMPFVSGVYLLVSSESQVPEWIDRSQVHVVLHKDIIPENLLPVFNASAIEMFIHRIPGLGEEFIYFNDDLFPVLPSRPEDYFLDGKALICFRKGRSTGGAFRKLVQRSHAFALRAAGLGEMSYYLRPQHSASPMLRSVCEELFDAHGKELAESVTPLRSEINFNQYVFTCYSLHSGHTLQSEGSCKHFSLGFHPYRQICRWIRHADRRIVCINDVRMSGRKYKKTKAALLSAFETVFPEKSRFEL